MTGSEIAAIGSKKLLSTIKEKFTSAVIERWTRFRAEKFFESFVEVLSEEMKDGIESPDVDKTLEILVKDDVKSEVLYDAYRRVCFSTSKTIGPKVIGLLTGYLVSEGRMASEGEERVFHAAESLSDGELIEFFKSYYEYSKKAKDSTDKKGCRYEAGDIIIPWNEETRDSAWPSSMEQQIEVSPLDLNIALGYWAVKLQDCGMMSTRMTERSVEYKEDSDRNIDMDGVLTIYASTIIFHSSCVELFHLVERSLGAAEAAELKPQHS
jgi:hypothetical protein